MGRGFGGEGGQRVRRWGWGEGSEVRVWRGFRGEGGQRVRR